MGIKNNINEESFKWLCSKEITNVINGMNTGCLDFNDMSVVRVTQRNIIS